MADGIQPRWEQAGQWQLGSSVKLWDMNSGTLLWSGRHLSDTGIKGLTEVQRETLRALGDVEIVPVLLGG